MSSADEPRFEPHRQPGDDPPDRDQGLSLDDLGQAYAELLGEGADPYEPAAPAANVGSAPLEDSPLAGDDGCEVSPRSILEAMLFVGHPENRPLTSRQVAALMRGVSPREIDELIGELNQQYEELEAPYRIQSVGAGYCLQLCGDLAPLRDRFFGRVRAARLSQAAIDVLAVVAYHPGVTREEVEQLRGVPSSSVLSQLVRRRLLRLERPEKKPRRPHYFTTDRFLELFGLSDLSDLPRTDDE